MHPRPDDNDPPRRMLAAGDIVTWRQTPKPGSTIAPLGVTGCKVLSFGFDTEGRPAAEIEAMGQKVGALVSDLHLEK